MKNDYIKTKIYTKEKQQQDNQQALEELNKSNREYITRNKYKPLKLLLIILLPIILIKCLFGTINIPNIFGYPSYKARYYNVKVNNEQIPVFYTIRHRIPLIPYLVNLDSYRIGTNYVSGIDTNYYNGKNKDIYIIDINSFSCYSKKDYQVECTINTQKMKENNDTKYTKMRITRITNPYKKLYDNKYIKDISHYIKQKGIYTVEVIAKHSLVETTLSFEIEK